LTVRTTSFLNFSRKLHLNFSFSIFFAAIWGLDANGYFATNENNRKNGSVAERVLMDLQNVHLSLSAEETRLQDENESNKERGKRLLFLFQCDLLPGLSGKILESKGQRDRIAAPQVPWNTKLACWIFLVALNVGMLFYILLFALSQTVHRQSAWAMSFVMWLIVEIAFVSSATVLFTHVLVPSLIMQDVNKIKQKLVESIRDFNNGVKNGRKDVGETEPFNAATYLFTSSRLAAKCMHLKEAQIISQFRTPWPKQSYQRENDVSRNYSRKYTALTRSASIVAVFFLTQLLHIPAGFQDMVVQLVATTSIGYTILLHMNLYGIFPLLAFIPVALVCVVVHFLVQSNVAHRKSELAKIFAEQAPKAAVAAPIVMAAPSEDSAEESVSSSSDSYSSSSDEERDQNLPVRTVVSLILRPGVAHVTRRQSVHDGQRVLRALESADDVETGTLTAWTTRKPAKALHLYRSSSEHKEEESKSECSSATEEEDSESESEEETESEEEEEEEEEKKPEHGDQDENVNKEKIISEAEREEDGERRSNEVGSGAERSSEGSDEGNSGEEESSEDSDSDESDTAEGDDDIESQKQAPSPLKANSAVLARPLLSFSAPAPVKAQPLPLTPPPTPVPAQAQATPSLDDSMYDTISEEFVPIKMRRPTAAAASMRKENAAIPRVTLSREVNNWIGASHDTDRLAEAESILAAVEAPATEPAESGDDHPDSSALSMDGSTYDTISAESVYLAPVPLPAAVPALAPVQVSDSEETGWSDYDSISTMCTAR